MIKKLSLVNMLVILLFLTFFTTRVNAKSKLISITVEGLIKDNIRVPAFLNSRSNSLWGLIKIINKAKVDPEVHGIVLRVKSPRLGLAKLEELREALISFKRKGKSIYAFSETLSKTDYMLASVANKLYISPQGGVDLSGISFELLFLKNTFNILGITPNFHHMGNYKSASEMFTRSGSSKFQKESMNFLLDGLFNEFLKVISKNRKIPISRVKKIVNKGFFNAEEAKKSRIIDGYLYEDEFEQLVQRKGVIAKNYYRPKAKPSGKNINVFKLLSLLSKKPVKRSSTPKIAVIYMQGSILSGKSSKSLFGGSDAIGSDDFTAILKKVRKDPLIKAVIIRINSPGGSALASDILWREILLLSKAKPVIASMSDIAASGGYYIAMACPTIVANSTTITGSIGVVGGKFNLKGLYDKLGIKKEIFKRGKHADLFTDYRDFTDEEKKLIAQQMKQTYIAFVSKAAKGRNMSFKQLEKLAQGRVYTGTQAKERGLIDEIGGLQYAIRLARKKAKDTSHRLEIVAYPERKSFMEMLSANLLIKKQLLKEFKEIHEIIQPLVFYLKNVKRIFSKERVATITPFYINYHY